MGGTSIAVSVRPGSDPDEGGAGFTTIVMSAVLEKALSEPVSRRTYVPALEKLAVVPGAFAFANVTVPGPLTLAHVTINVLPKGSPSSVAVPDKVATAGKVIV